jgi:hypothetical protein
MVHLFKALITTIAIAPALAVPQYGQDDVELIARDPFFRRINFRRIVRGIGQVSRIARFIPGPVGMVAGVASRIIRRDVEEELFTRAVQDELDARGYDIQLELREVEGLEARDIDEALSARDNIYSLKARQFIDSIEARSGLTDDLKARSFDELD